MENKIEAIILTGMSGSGKSIALDELEDEGYYSMDNLPPQLLPKFCEMAINSSSVKKVAAVMDLRSGEFFNDFFKSIEELKNLNVEYKIIFLEASEETIIGRYKELRRPHPLNRSIVDGYNIEKKTLNEIREKANYVVDTSHFSSKELKKTLKSLLNSKKEDEITISVTSFGYKKNILRDADLVFDVRFLPNPYYISELKELDGLNSKTREYVLGHEVTQVFLDKCIDLLEFLIPNYIKEGKQTLTIGFGCTGGFHRSVVIAEEITKRIKNLGHSCYVTHRDREDNLWKKK